MILEGGLAMRAFQEAKKLMSVMTRAEKAQLLQWVVRDLGDEAGKAGQAVPDDEFGQNGGSQ